MNYCCVNFTTSKPCKQKVYDGNFRKVKRPFALSDMFTNAWIMLFFYNSSLGKFNVILKNKKKQKHKWNYFQVTNYTKILKANLDMKLIKIYYIYLKKKIIAL